MRSAQFEQAELQHTATEKAARGAIQFSSFLYRALRGTKFRMCTGLASSASGGGAAGTRATRVGRVGAYRPFRNSHAPSAGRKCNEGDNR